MAQCTSENFKPIDGRCEISLGGIRYVYVAPWDKVDLNLEVGTGLTTAHTVTNSAITLSSGTVWSVYAFRRNTGSYTSTVQSDISIGNSFATTEVSLQFTKAEAYKRMAIQQAINQQAIIIIETMDNEKILLGAENPVIVTAATMQSGTQNTDLNGFTLTFQDVCTHLPYFCAADFVISVGE